MPNSVITAQGHYLGRRPDSHDVRDHVLRVPTLSEPAIASVGELYLWTGLQIDGIVYDQLDLGGCTGNAGVEYRRWLAEKFPPHSSADTDLSRLGLYWNERALPWNQDTADDSGAQMRDICKVLTQTGVCPEAYWPYDIAKFAEPPSPEAIAEQARYKVGAYHRLPDTASIISSMAAVVAYPALLGFTVYESFESIGADGMMPMPGPGEKVVGGHAVVIHGYSSSRDCFRVRNSWGPDWGDGGNFWMPRSFLDAVDVSVPDIWVTHLGPPWKAALVTPRPTVAP